MGQGIFNFSKKLWTPRRFSWSPPYSSLVPSCVLFLLRRGDLGDGVAPGQGLGCG